MNNTAVVKVNVFLNTALSMSAALLDIALSISAAVLDTALSVGAAVLDIALSIGAAFLLEAALSMSAAIVGMKIIITVIGFVKIALINLRIALAKLRSVRLIVNVVVSTAMWSAAVEAVDFTELLELSRTVEKVVSAGVSEASDIIHNALVNSVISGSSKDAVLRKVNIRDFPVEVSLFNSEFGKTSVKVIRATYLRLSSARLVSSNSEITIVILSRDHDSASSKEAIGSTNTSNIIDGNISLSSSETKVSSLVQIVLTKTAVESSLVAVNTCNTAESESSGTVTTSTESVGTSVLVANIRQNAAASQDVTSTTTESVVSQLTG